MKLTSKWQNLCNSQNSQYLTQKFQITSINYYRISGLNSQVFPWAWQTPCSTVIVSRLRFLRWTAHSGEFGRHVIDDIRFSRIGLFASGRIPRLFIGAVSVGPMTNALSARFRQREPPRSRNVADRRNRWRAHYVTRTLPLSAARYTAVT